jgi:hypothetical protein
MIRREGITLDSGALIAVEKDSRLVAALIRRALERGATITVPAVVVAQVWRKNNPRIAQVLNASEVELLDRAGAKQVGNLLAASRTNDIVDASVVLGAAARGDAIITSDTGDIERLVGALETASAQVRIIAI